MAKKKKLKSSVYLTDQTPLQLKELAVWLEDRLGEMEVEEEWMEENGDNILPSLRGLISFLKEEHLEEEDEPVDSDEEEAGYEEDYQEETNGELDFEE